MPNFWGNGQIVTNPKSVGDYVDAPYGILSIQEEWTQDAFRANVRLLCPYAERTVVAFEFRGGVLANGNRMRPMQYNAFPLAVCTGVRIEALPPEVPQSTGAPTSPNPVTWDTAVIEATFETVPWEGALFNANPSRINIEEYLDGAAEFLTLPAEGLFWDQAATEPLAQADAPGGIDRKGTWTITIKNALMAEVPPEVNSNVGKVNSDTITSIKYGRSFAPGTLQWMQPVIQEVPGADGVEAVNVIIPLAIDYREWNKLYKPGSDFSLGKHPIYDSTGTIKEFSPRVAFGATLDMFVSS
jgi:hypothetical protein